MTSTAHSIAADAYTAISRHTAGLDLHTDHDGNAVLTVGSYRIVLGEEFEGDESLGFSWTTYCRIGVDMDDWEPMSDGDGGPTADEATAAVARFVDWALDIEANALPVVRAAAADGEAADVELHNAVVKAAIAGHSIIDIADAAGVTRQTVYRWIGKPLKRS